MEKRFYVFDVYYDEGGPMPGGIMILAKKNVRKCIKQARDFAKSKIKVKIVNEAYDE